MINLIIENDRLTRFLAVCLQINLNSNGARKGKEIDFLEKEINNIKNIEENNFDNLYDEYENIAINVKNNEIIFSSKRGLTFLSIYFERNLPRLDLDKWKNCLNKVSRYIPEGIFEDKEYEILKLEFFAYMLRERKNDISHPDYLIRKARISFEERIKDGFDVKWVKKIEGEDPNLKISVANNFLVKYKSTPIGELSELVMRMDEIFIREGDCFREFKKIVDSYRTRKSNNKVGLSKFNMSINSSNSEWLKEISEIYGLSRSDVINLIINHHKELKLDLFFEARRKNMFSE